MPSRNEIPPSSNASPRNWVPWTQAPRSWNVAALDSFTWAIERTRPTPTSIGPMSTIGAHSRSAIVWIRSGFGARSVAVAGPYGVSIFPYLAAPPSAGAFSSGRAALTESTRSHSLTRIPISVAAMPSFAIAKPVVPIPNDQASVSARSAGESPATTALAISATVASIRPKKAIPMPAARKPDRLL